MGIIENEVLPGSIVLKNDPNYRQGFPDLVVFYKSKYAILEAKKDEKAPYQPNQEYYLEYLGEYTFTATIFPENEEEVLDGLQRALRSNGKARIPKRK